jgi:iron complex transport system ATP-binding protein
VSGLSAKGLKVSYGKKEALHGAGVNVAEGEFLALLGLNGSGKTTLLKALCGLIPIREGVCLINGRPYLQLDERSRAKLISYIPQRHSAMPGTSLAEIVLMGLNPYIPLLSSPGKHERDLASSALKRVGLVGKDDTDFNELSEGQKQLVILARAIVRDSPVLLTDEPVSSLDFVNSHYVLNMIRDIVREEKRAGLITLHDPNLALRYCDRILLMKDGMIAGEFVPRAASLEEIRQRLSLLYGNIEILEHGGRYIMAGA